MASQDVMLERRGKQQNDLTPQQIIKGFEVQMKEVDEWVKGKPNFKMLYINYNEALKDPVPSAHKVNEFLGGNLDIQAMMKVVDPALYRQRK